MCQNQSFKSSCHLRTGGFKSTIDTDARTDFVQIPPKDPRQPGAKEERDDQADSETRLPDRWPIPTRPIPPTAAKRLIQSSLGNTTMCIHKSAQGSLANLDRVSSNTSTAHNSLIGWAPNPPKLGSNSGPIRRVQHRSPASLSERSRGRVRYELDASSCLNRTLLDGNSSSRISSKSGSPSET